jgi:hypothetical protein
MEEKFIVLEHIDTSIAAKNFSNLLSESRTYFLNGSWGSGKTEFLNEVKKNSQDKFITIDFWRLTDSRTTIEIAFSKLHPKIYWFLRIFVVLLVAISILMTNIDDIGLSDYFGSLKSLLLKLGGVVALIAAIWQVFKNKSDELYCLLLSKMSKSSKVLIIDDFDRMSEKQQEESYKLFSLINGKLPIVFVGDIQRIYLKNDNYLSKIIDRQIELPIVLHSSNIWREYFITLENKFDLVLSNDFKKRISSDNRNLRDRFRFNDYVNQEFFSRGKLGHVQIEQQLWIIYAYLFYPELYKKLLENKKIEISEDEKVDITELISFGFTIKETFVDIQQKDNKQYPLCFAKNRKGYLLYEEPLNRTKEELDTLFKDDLKELRRELRISDNSTDFYQYLANEFRTFSDQKKEQLLNLVISESIQYYDSPAMDYIVQGVLNDYLPIYERSPLTDETRAKIVEKWEELLQKKGLDQSEIIYFIEKHGILTFHDLGLYYTDLELNTEYYRTLKRKDFFLITYLSSVDKFGKFEEWDNYIWEAIGYFSDREFLSFWILQSIIFNGMGFGSYDKIPENKTFIIWTGRYLFEPPHEYVDYNETVISKINDRIYQMESKGYMFIKKINEENLIE